MEIVTRAFDTALDRGVVLGCSMQQRQFSFEGVNHGDFESILRPIDYLTNFNGLLTGHNLLYVPEIVYAL